MTTSVGSVVQVPFKGDVVTKKLGCGRRVGSTSCVWKEADDVCKVMGSGEDAFPVGNPHVDRKIETGTLRHADVGQLSLPRTVGRLTGRLYQRRGRHICVFDCGLSRKGKLLCDLKICPGSDDTLFTDCPVQENGREDIVEESRGRCPDPKETEDHQQVLCRIWQTDEFE